MWEWGREGVRVWGRARMPVPGFSSQARGGLGRTCIHTRSSPRSRRPGERAHDVAEGRQGLGGLAVGGVRVLKRTGVVEGGQRVQHRLGGGPHGAAGSREEGSREEGGWACGPDVLPERAGRATARGTRGSLGRGRAPVCRSRRGSGGTARAESGPAAAQRHRWLIMGGAQQAGPKLAAPEERNAPKRLKRPTGSGSCAQSGSEIKTEADRGAQGQEHTNKDRGLTGSGSCTQSGWWACTRKRQSSRGPAG